MLFRCQQTVCQISVIGDQKQSFCIFVQSSDREEVLSLLLFDQIDHRSISPVFSCRYHAGRFIQHIIFIRYIRYVPATNRHFITSLINLCICCFYYYSVNCCFSLTDLFFYLLAGSHTHLCQIFIQTHHLNTASIPADICSSMYHWIPSPIQAGTHPHIPDTSLLLFSPSDRPHPASPLSGIV